MSVVAGRVGARIAALLIGCIAPLIAAPAVASDVTGTVTDQTAGVLPGVSVELRRGQDPPRVTITDVDGRYRFDFVSRGRADLVFTLVNFGTARRTVDVPAAGVLLVDAVLQYMLSAEVIVSGRRTFTNLADADNPAENLLGLAQSATQGAITAAQLDVRPIMRNGEVLESVPGVVISQHSGEGKANQYYLRGFNLDHGTDFATTLAGMPVNMPTHAHGHGYSDLNVLIPELITGVQYSKGPYFAEQGDFATAGAASINYASQLDQRIVRVGGGAEGYGRALAAGSRRVARGDLLAAFEVEHNDGPWVRPDDYEKFNGVARYTRGGAANAFTLTGMAHRATWNATDQVPLRAVEEQRIERFESIDSSDGGETQRFSGSVEWQRASGSGVTRVSAYGIGYALDLFSNFTFFLDDPQNGDQIQQSDRRLVTGTAVSHRRVSRWSGRGVRNTIGVQLRHDDIGRIGLYHTVARERLHTVREDSVLQTSGAAYGQNEIEWTPWLRTLAGLRVDGYRFRVDAKTDPLNGGTARAGILSPKGGVVMGPFSGTELYANAGFGFHSNDARGATITRETPAGERARRVTPLARATGAEVGLRTVAIPHLQTTIALWSLGLASELIFVGDAGTTEAGRPSHRHGVEIANYYRPWSWLTLDADAAWSRARFTDVQPAGHRIPGSVQMVVSAGVAVDAIRRTFASARVRYFGPRPLVENDSVRSQARTLVNLQAGYQATRKVRLTVDVFNLLDVADSDVDYFYTSRLPGEPAAGIAGLHFHPAVPRTARVNLLISF